MLSPAQILAAYLMIIFLLFLFASELLSQATCGGAYAESAILRNVGARQIALAGAFSGMDGVHVFIRLNRRTFMAYSNVPDNTEPIAGKMWNSCPRPSGQGEDPGANRRGCLSHIFPVHIVHTVHRVHIVHKVIPNRGRT